MSLINDALRRAKEQTAPPAASLNLPLRPAEPNAAAQSGKGMLLTLGFAGCVIAAGALVPMLLQHEPPAPQRAPDIILQPAAVPTPEPAAPVETPKPLEPVPAADAPASAPVVEARETAPAQAQPLKLNGIFFNAQNPSAIINGKTVFANSTVGEFRVQTITPSSVQLANATQTNILRFEE